MIAPTFLVQPNVTIEQSVKPKPTVSSSPSTVTFSKHLLSQQTELTNEEPEVFVHPPGDIKDRLHENPVSSDDGAVDEQQHNASPMDPSTQLALAMIPIDQSLPATGDVFGDAAQPDAGLDFEKSPRVHKKVESSRSDHSIDRLGLGHELRDNTANHGSARQRNDILSQVNADVMPHAGIMDKIHSNKSVGNKAYLAPKLHPTPLDQPPTQQYHVHGTEDHRIQQGLQHDGDDQVDHQPLVRDARAHATVLDQTMHTRHLDALERLLHEAVTTLPTEHTIDRSTHSIDIHAMSTSGNIRGATTDVPTSTDDTFTIVQADLDHSEAITISKRDASFHVSSDRTLSVMPHGEDRQITMDPDPVDGTSTDVFIAQRDFSDRSTKAHTEKDHHQTTSLRPSDMSRLITNELPSFADMFSSNGKDQATSGDLPVPAADVDPLQVVLPSTGSVQSVDPIEIKVDPQQTTLDDEAIEQLVQSIETRIHGDHGDVSLRLHPRHLGELSIRITLERGSVSAHLMVQSAEVKSLIDASLPELRSSLTLQGLDVSELAVGVGGGDYFGHQGPQQEILHETMGRSATRLHDATPSHTVTESRFTPHEDQDRGIDLWA